MKDKFIENLEKKVLNFINTESLINERDSILICISGGSDSFALAEVLSTLSPHYNSNIHLLYVDHHVRQNTEEEKSLIKEYADRKNIPFTILNIYPDNLTEKTLREERYKIIEEFAQKNGFTRIALGHTLDDNIETILMNFLRGYGLEGLIGIPPKRDKIIRPILVLTKKETAEYCNKKEIKYKEDFTNYLPITLRNRVRYQLIPFLRDIIEQFPQSLMNQKIILNWDQELIKNISKEYSNKYIKSNMDGFEVNYNDWNNIPDAIKVRILKNIFNNMGEIITIEGLIYLMNKLSKIRKTGNIATMNTIKIYKHENTVYFIKKTLEENYEYTLPIPGSLKLPSGYEIITEIIEDNKESINFNDLWHVYFDYDKIEVDKLKVRNWREGDKIKPFGLKGKSKKLQDLFIDKKIPKWKRLEIPIIFWENEILWVVGIARSNIAPITENTKRILHIMVKKEV
uniref:tRNA(Ile)-lysidine synthase n=1 Tax=Dictyoglomus thermophilum TaxID=14 RepID=A0A7C3MP40_DICTH